MSRVVPQNLGNDIIRQRSVNPTHYQSIISLPQSVMRIDLKLLGIKKSWRTGISSIKKLIQAICDDDVEKLIFLDEVVVLV